MTRLMELSKNQRYSILRIIKVTINLFPQRYQSRRICMNAFRQ